MIRLRIETKPWEEIAPSPRRTSHDLLTDFGDDARANRLATFTDGEMAADVERYGFIQAHGDRSVVAGHHHFDSVRQLNFAGDVRGPEKELRLVTVEEGRVPSSFVLVNT